MSMSLEEMEFAQNPESRCPCVLLLDTSGSMSGSSINALNQGIEAFSQSLAEDTQASLRVEVAIVTFDSSVNVVQDFVTAEHFSPPHLTANGSTLMGAGIVEAMNILEKRKAVYKANGITYYRPWVFLVTDGSPTDDVNLASERVRSAENSKAVTFFAVGVESADMNKLATIAVRAPLKLHGLNFRDMFLWLSASMKSVSHSQIGDQVPLAPPGWGSV